MRERNTVYGIGFDKTGGLSMSISNANTTSTSNDTNKSTNNKMHSTLNRFFK